MRSITEGELPLFLLQLDTGGTMIPPKKEQVEADIVITGIDRELILGECK